MRDSLQSLRYELADGIAIITLDRPEKLNAMTRTMGADLIGLLQRADHDDAVRIVIVTGAGRAFCAGADLTSEDSAILRPDGGDGAVTSTRDLESDGQTCRDFGGKIALRLFRCLKPLIFAINGPAVGLGVTISLPADFRLASRNASFALPFSRRGIVPESASSWFLPRIVGISQALEWTMIGRPFSAEEAFDKKLVRSLHDPGELLPAAIALAREIIDHTAPVSVALTRHLMWHMMGADHPREAHLLESRALLARSQSKDAREGIASFLEKRAPRFTDGISLDMPDGFPWNDCTD